MPKFKIIVQEQYRTAFLIEAEDRAAAEAAAIERVVTGDWGAAVQLSCERVVTDAEELE